ncbi:hypothetical protein [Balneola vulgaris]|uniref:hypothetical protein n=1 Tax=Balneola vulgaris TaxID=287535 RepID=UPI00037E4AFD|nr:hypothetical protein [Balneola vulgaris]
MKTQLLILGTLFFLTCTVKNEDTSIIEGNVVSNVCFEYNPEIEIWNREGVEYTIGNWPGIEENYVQSYGWNHRENPYPKKFDFKLRMINNNILYGEEPYDIGNWKLSVNLSYKVGQNDDALYPLNSKIIDHISIINDRLITSKDFKQNGVMFDEIQIWEKSIEFESYYDKYREASLKINQLIFEIILINKNNSECRFEYIFPMKDRGEL